MVAVGYLRRAVFPNMSAKVLTPAVGVRSEHHELKWHLRLFNTQQCPRL